MPENDSIDHWDQLASELGTEPHSRESEEQPRPRDEGGPPEEEAAEPEFAAGLTLSSLPPKKKTPPADWGAIASALGVMTEPEVEEPRPVSGSGDVSPEEEGATAEFIEEVRQEFEAGEEDEAADAQDEEATEPSGATAEPPLGRDTEGATVPFAPELQAPRPEAGEESFGFGVMPAEAEPSAPADVGAAEPPAADEEEKAAAEPATEPPEKEPSRRRRRRRRKPRLGGKSAEESGVELQEDASGKAVAKDADAEEAESAELEQEMADEDHGKRRRKRRPAKRKKKGEAEAVAEAPDEAEATAKSDRDEATRPAQKGDKQKPSHRAIPTWSEAIGLIIAGNQERRKKSGGGSGRGRSRGRKGRSSSEGKSSSRR